MNRSNTGDPYNTAWDSLGPFPTSGTYVAPPQGCPYCEPRCPCCGRRLYGAPPYYPWRPYITWSTGDMSPTCNGDTNG